MKWTIATKISSVIQVFIEILINNIFATNIVLQFLINISKCISLGFLVAINYFTSCTNRISAKEGKKSKISK